ncbi:Cilia- and flagella-associated protein 70 [Amphibalanus amphitrite]|uniref:Cilia-and flagella-associated protein 70 n=1 Tax=Amphibalanus amphitrite TaxID=1232801 RepID=A0A6A4X726_AMPAM|nr:Cilia- and flagella-associated protein 70 [Amphibalanus amphitrite]
MDNGTPRKEKVELSVVIKHGRNWRNSRGEPLQPCVLRCEYGDGNTIGESNKVTGDGEGGAEIDFTATISLEQDVTDWNQLANTPIIILLMESSLKESKKKKSPSFNKVGVVTIDPLLLLFQAPPPEQFYAFYPSDHMLPEAERRILRSPEVSVLFQTSAPLIPPNVLEELNMLTITLDSYYGLPERLQECWDCHDYITAFFLPIDQPDEVMRYDKSLYQETSSLWRNHYWYGRTGGMTDEDFIPASTQSFHKHSEEDNDSSGDFRGDDVNYELMSGDRARVTINTERRILLTRKMLSTFENYASRHKVLPVELMVKKSKTAQAGAKARRKTMDDLVSVQFGMAMVNLSYLLYPGVSRLRGAYRVQTLDPAKYEEVTGGRRSLFVQMSNGGSAEDAASTVNGKRSDLDKSERREQRDEKPKRAKDEGKDSEKGKDKRASLQPGLQLPPLPSGLQLPEMPVAPQDDLFADGDMFLVLDMRLKTPLVKRHTLQQLAQNVQSLIPQRDDLPREARSAAEAESRYHKKIKELSKNLLDELRLNKHKYTAPEGGDALDAEEIWQRFAFDMNTSGKYFVIKEALKPAILEVVREKYLKYTSFITQEEVQDFLSQLYVYLVTEMHAALNQFLDTEEEPLVAPSVVDCAALRTFAEVAQQLGKQKKAQQFYLERMARERQNADHWCEYGEFCSSVGNIDVAEGCFRDVLSHNPNSARGLLLLGICSSLRQESEQATMCLQYAACVRRECFITQTVLGIHLERANDVVGAEIAYKSALRLLVRAIRFHQVDILLEYHDSYLMELECCPLPAEPTALELCVTAAEQEAKEAAERDGSPDRDLLLVQREQGRLEEEEVEKRRRRGRRASRSISCRPGRGANRSDRSDGRESEDRREGAEEANGSESESTAAARAELTNSHVLLNKLYLLVAQFLLKHKAYNFAEHAVSKMAVTSDRQLSPDYYITAARLNYLMGDLSTANDTVQEAQKYYYQDPKLWSLMGHIQYCSGDSVTARRCYETLLDLGQQPDDIHLVHMFLGEIYYREGQFVRARGSFLLAVRALPSPFSWLWLGKACYRLGHYGEAEEALREANLLDSTCGETWAYISLASLLSEQRVLAEQAYKYALKLGGVSQELLTEIHQVQKEKGFGDPGFQSTWWSKQYVPTE